jgi:hypothetical protein
MFMDFKQFCEEYGEEMHLLENVNVSDELKYHLDNKLPLYENVFRIYSDAYFKLVEEVRTLYFENKIALCNEDAALVESNIGQKAIYEGREVWLDAPITLEEDYLTEAKYKGKNVKLRKPFRTPGGPKKFAVYVKKPTSGNIIKVTFGDPNLRVRNDDPARARSFRARHKCETRKDPTKASYWSCNIARYRKALGIKSSRPW